MLIDAFWAQRLNVESLKFITTLSLKSIFTSLDERVKNYIFCCMIQTTFRVINHKKYFSANSRLLLRKLKLNLMFHVCRASLDGIYSCWRWNKFRRFCVDFCFHSNIRGLMFTFNTKQHNIVQFIFLLFSSKFHLSQQKKMLHFPFIFIQSFLYGKSISFYLRWLRDCVIWIKNYDTINLLYVLFAEQEKNLIRHVFVHEAVTKNIF